MRSAYVGLIRGIRAPMTHLGALKWLERHSNRDSARWARSLFAIYDIDDMTRLDLPWWTLKATRIVDQFLRDRGGARVFEYGSGASTVFLARRASTVESVEHDKDWWQRLQPVLTPFGGANCRLVEPRKSHSPQYASLKRGHTGLEFHEYVHAIDLTTGDFDLIVIDGRCRSRCLEVAVPRLRQGGMIVFDNSARSRYRASIAACGLHPVRTRGLTAALPYPDQTTLLFRDATTSGLLLRELRAASA
jgi:hypothetical protein